MIENLVFKTFKSEKGDVKLCIHIHYPKISNKKAFLFLNPLFDEKKRSQKFQSNTARALTDLGFTVIRFDYFGTGDSYGNFEELNIETCLENSKSLLYFIRNKIKIHDISILGIRWGASIAFKLSSLDKEINNAILIDPVISGKRYLTELRLRRKAFFMLNNIKNEEIKITIDGVDFEDHQGYLLSSSFIQELLDFDLFNISLSKTEVTLFSIDTMNYKKMLKLDNNLKENNNVKLIKDNTKSFWNNLEMVNTNTLTENILKYV